MKNYLLPFFAVLFMQLAMPIRAQFIEVEHLSDYCTPDTCFNKGVSAAYCGILDGYLILAGGCNFPHRPAAEGGTKEYYDYIWATPLSAAPQAQWELIGRLPQASAYGITVADNKGLICIGGMTKEKALSSVYRITLKDGKANIDSLPSLPVTIDNASGSLLNSTLYVAGGMADGKPSSTLYSLDLRTPEVGWITECQMPAPIRVQPICAASQGKLYIFGGYTPKSEKAPASMPINSLEFDPQTREWTKIAVPVTEAGEVIALAGGAGVTLPNGDILCVGGVNQNIFPKALNGIYKNPEYMQQPVKWYQFNKEILFYTPSDGFWNSLGRKEEAARAGNGLISDGEWNYIINGELKPGIRTPMITRFKILCR